MSVPTQRHTKSRRNKRRMHIFAHSPILIKCSHCGKPVQPHLICWNCGYYKGVEVVDVLKKLTKKEKKKREREMKAEKENNKAKPLTMEGLSKK